MSTELRRDHPGRPHRPRTCPLCPVTSQTGPRDGEIITTGAGKTKDLCNFPPKSPKVPLASDRLREGGVRLAGLIAVSLTWKPAGREV